MLFGMLDCALDHKLFTVDSENLIALEKKAPCRGRWLILKSFLLFRGETFEDFLG